MKRTFSLAVYATFLALALLFLLTLNQSFTFSTDDYHFLFKAMDPKGFKLYDFGHLLSRTPMQCLFMWLMYKSGFINDQSWDFLYIMYTVHALSFSFLCLFLIRTFKVKVSTTPLVLVIAIFTLYPNHYEIVYWATSMSFIWGSSLLALGLFTRNKFLQSLLFLLTFQVSEMYILPILCFLLCAPLFKDQRLNFKSLIRPIAQWIGILIVYFIIRSILEANLGAHGSKINVDLMNLLSRVPLIFTSTFFLNFYKIYYVASIPFLIGLGILGYWGLKNKKTPGKSLSFLKGALLLLIPLAIYLPMDYYAPRSLYGAHLFITAFLATTTLYFYQKTPRKVFVTGLSLVFVGIFAHQLTIFKYKNMNATALEKTTEKVSKDIKNCQAPCSLTISNLDSGLKRGWVLPKEYWPLYLKYLKAKHAPSKEVAFNIQ